MASHYKLKANIDGQEVVGESLELVGNSSFRVFPVEKNETQAPIRGSAIVNILGKKHSILLNHRIKDYEDPEPSTTKWSVLYNLIGSDEEGDPNMGYIRFSRGKTTYDITASGNTKTQTIKVSYPYKSYQSLLTAVGDFSDYTEFKEGIKGGLVDLFYFSMYYKYSTIDGDTIIPPIDDGSPESNKARIPCRPDVSSAPYWIRNPKLLYKVITFDQGSGMRPSLHTFNTWDEFINYYDSIITNPDYIDIQFQYIYQGIPDFNLSLNQKDPSTITISEIDNGKGAGIHGAKPLYVSVSQQEGKTVYGASVIPASADMLDTDGIWDYDDPTEFDINNNRLLKDTSMLNTDPQSTYNYTPKFRIKSSSSYYARAISAITGGSRIINPSGAGTFEYQYIGQPFIFKVFKETANGIENSFFRPYYKSLGQNSTEFWRDSINILGSQNYNPLKYDGYQDDFHQLHIRGGNEVGIRNFLAGPMVGSFGLYGFQLIPICLYRGIDGKYTEYDDIDGEGGIGTKGVNYVRRYERYESAIGGADIPGQNSTDVYKAAFLKWPNSDGNNNPDHISSGVVESLPSKVGKNWENWIKNDSATFKYIKSVLFLPVLWANKRLEDDADLRQFLSVPRFGYYLLSPNASDSEIDRVDSIYRIQINGLDIQIQ